MEDENIHLQLVTPSEEDTPAQIMEADEDVTEMVHGHKSIYVHDSDVNVMEEEDDVEKGETLSAEDEGPEFNSEADDQGLGPVSHAELKIVPDDGDQAEEVFEEEVSQDILYEEERILKDREEEHIVKDEFSEGKDPEERVNYLEHEMKRSQSRMDGFRQELKILLVEVNIVCEWISENFGVELIDRASHLFKHIHNYEEVEELSESLSLLKKGKLGVRRSARRKPTKPKKTSVPIPSKRKRGRGRPKKKSGSNSDESGEDGDEVEVDGEDFFEPPAQYYSECLLNTDVEEEFLEDSNAKPKRKRVRKRPPKKVLKKEAEAEEGVEVKDEIKEEEDENQDGRKKRKWKSKPRSLQCEECGKILKADSSLRWHMLMHADLRPVECLEPGCGKTFRDKSKLAQHQKIHNGEKSEKCRYCDRGFLRKKDLVVHERTHTGEKPYACPSCPKTFNIKDHLTIHLRVHTGERPYKCPTCEKSFSQANSLRIHKKIHLKQLSDYVPAPRKPRPPRKSKHILPHANPPSPTSASVHTIDLRGERVDLEEGKAINIHDGGGEGLDAPSPVSTIEQHSSSLVQTFFQAQTLNLVQDPVQQAWNFVTNPNAVAAAVAAEQQQQQHHHHHPHHQAAQHTSQHIAHQRAFNNQTLGTLGHPGLMTTFKIQPITYHPQTQQQQQQQQQAQEHSQNLIRPGQGGSFVPAQFHDPNFRHFPN